MAQPGEHPIHAMEQMEVVDPPAVAAATENEKLTLRGRLRESVARVRGGFFDFEQRVAESTFGRFFRLTGSGHPNEIPRAYFWNEIRAGATTFTTMAYIVAVNAIVLSQTGGTCECHEHPRNNCNLIPEYTACKETLRRDLITATAAITGISTFLFGTLTNLPVALAPGMGLNAYFAFQVVGVDGSGVIPFRLALTAVFTEGLIFVALALTGLRQWLVKIIPATIKTATGVGIGLFLTEIGLSYAIGIGAITGGYDLTPLALAGCDKDDLDPATMMCPAGLRMTSPRLWTGVFAGGILTAYLMCFRYRFALMAGVILVSVLSWPRDTAITYFPYTALGDSRFEFFKQVVTFHPIQTTLNVLDWNLGEHGSQFALALLTFLYVDIIDATATLYSMVRFCGVVDPRDGDFPRSTLAYCTDGACVSLGALMGLSPVTAFIESGAGIAEGGRTGITSLTTGVCFLVSVFFAPLVASIPPWATGCTLILVGCMMVRQITQINWRYLGDSVPSFIVMTFIPFSYSVAYGLIAGIMIYTALNGLIGLTVFISNHRIEPLEYDLKEYWTIAPGSGGRSVWYVRMFRSLCGRARDTDSIDNYGPDGDHDNGAGHARGGAGGGGSSMPPGDPLRSRHDPRHDMSQHRHEDGHDHDHDDGDDASSSKNALRAAAGADIGPDGFCRQCGSAPDHPHSHGCPGRSMTASSEERRKEDDDRIDAGQPAAVPREIVRPPTSQERARMRAAGV